MRLIDADALIAKLKDDMNHMDDGVAMIYTQAEINELKHAPTVDAVEVIRCKDCKHNSLKRVSGNVFCDLGIGSIQLYDFCSFAERRQE